MKRLILAVFFLAITGTINAQPYAIGDKVGGGVVYHITDGGMHGLIVAAQNLGKISQTEAITLANDTSKHDAAGKLFADWRLPNKTELGLLSKNLSVLEGFTDGYYWTSDIQSTSRGKTGTLMLLKATRGKGPGQGNGTTMNKPSQMEALIRVVRSF